jgi:hypothetical protein
MNDGTDATDADLLRPILDERHDTAGFDRPWNPWRLVFVTFFAGALGGAYLFALNFRKLGQRSHVAWCAALFVVLALGRAFYLAHAMLDAGRAELSSGDGRSLRTVSQLITLLPAVGVAYFQAKRFRLFRFSDDEEGPFLWHAVGALVGGLVGAQLLAMAALLLLEAR